MVLNTIYFPYDTSPADCILILPHVGVVGNQFQGFKLLIML